MTGIVGVNRDITALRGAEEQLAYVVTGASCLLWSAIVELKDEMLVWDMQISSEAAARRFLPLEEVGNDSYVTALERAILPEEWARMRQTAKVALINNYNAYSHEFRVRRADGQIRWLYEEVRVRPLISNRWSLVGVCTDITERKQAAQTLQNAYQQLEQRVSERTSELQEANKGLKEQISERRRIEKALRESEARFRALVEHAPEAIVVFDADTERFINVNENAVSLFKMSRRDLLERGPIDFCPTIQPDGVPSMRAMRDKIRAAVNGETSVFEWTYYDAYGKEIPCEVRLLLLPTSGSVLIRGSITDISERRFAQAALLESEEKYRSLTNQLPIGVYRTTLDGKLLFGNPALAAILGFEHVEDMIGVSVIDFYTTPEVRENIAGAYEAKRGEVVQTENRLIRRDGTIIWVRDTGRAILNEYDKVDYIDGTLEDITQRVSIQQAEQEQRMFAEALRDAANDLSRTLELEEVLERMLKYIMRVMPSHESASIMMIEDDQEHVRVLRYRNLNPDYDVLPRPVMRFSEVPNWNLMYQTAQPVVITDTTVRPEWGNVFESAKSIKSYIGAPIRSEGKVIGFINLGSTTPNVFSEAHALRLMSFANQVGVAIQNAHLYEAVRQHARELEMRVTERTLELDTERTRLRAILDAMTEGVIYYDQDGRALYTNRSLSLLTGYSEDDLRVSDIFFKLFAASTPDVDEVRLDMYQTIQQEGIWRGKTQLQRSDGTLFDGSIITTNVPNFDGSSIGWVTVLRDVSQETRLEEQKKRFIAIASHELRTPLTNIKTRLYLIRRQPERLAEHLDVMEGVTDRMRKLVEDLFDVSRFEHGIIPLRPEMIGLQNLIYNVIDLQTPEAERKNISLEFDLGDDPLYAMVDPPRITQVMTNLVTNAIHYTPAGGTVVVTTETEGDEVVISVRDTGVGIPETWFEQIFKPFFRGHEHSTGAGLGLSITREIVELHGGHISVESAVGVGTCFQVRLRLVQAVQSSTTAR
jgi:PAS domain S-box-containing protein